MGIEAGRCDLQVFALRLTQRLAREPEPRRDAEAKRDRIGNQEERVMNRRFYEGTAEHIRQSGRSIIGVFPCQEDDDWPFAYTIGNHLKDLPELLVIGTSNAAFLNDLSQMMIDAGKPFLDGQLVRINVARLPVKVVRANSAAQADFTIQAGQFFGHEDYAVMQVLMPDRTGKFPGEEDCQEPFSLFPVLRLD
jgi:Domain of unknown function (DUF4262)